MKRVTAAPIEVAGSNSPSAHPVALRQARSSARNAPSSDSAAIVAAVTLQFAGALVDRKHVGRDYPCADDVLGRDAAIAHIAEDEGRADQIDEFVDGASRDQLVTEAMSADVSKLGERGREIWLQETSDQVRIVNQHRGLDALDEIDLGVRRRQRELGPGEPGVARVAFVEHFARGYRRLHPGQDAAILDGLEMIAKLGQMRAAAKLLEAERQHLVAIVGNNAVGDFVGACGQRAVALDEG